MINLNQKDGKWELDITSKGIEISFKCTDLNMLLAYIGGQEYRQLFRGQQIIVNSTDKDSTL